jgi:unsaturated rhamnogalacturonyl hydrolase
MLVLIGIITVLIDVVPLFGDWFKRIHIGRYSDLAAWNTAITRTGVRWLNHTPKIKVTDQTRFTVLDRLRGNYTNSTLQHWQEAALVLGLSEYFKNEDNAAAKAELRKFLAAKFDENGQWRTKPKHIDTAILAYSLFKLDFIDIQLYRPALDYTWKLIQEHLGEDGTVQYRKSMGGYRYVDTVGFICPFLIAYGMKYGNQACIELAVKQIQMYVKHGMLEQQFIPCHAYRMENNAPLGLYGWGRGLGWFAIGLIDSWNELPQNHVYKSVLEKIVVHYARAVMACQQANGNWNWTVTRSESRPDSSAAATLGWFLLNASQIEELSKPCLESVHKAMTYLQRVTRRNGAIDFSQGDTKDIGVYSTLFNVLPFTQGFGIRLIHRYRKQAERGPQYENNGVYSNI